MVRVEPVRRDNLARFIRYAADHGSEHDASYLPGAGFTPTREQPSYILLRDGEAAGAVSLMRTPRFLQAHRGRFSIFHSIDPSVQSYALLFNAIGRHFEGLRTVYLFLPEACTAAAQAILQLGFCIERYSYIMRFGHLTPAGVEVPPGLTLRAIRPEDETCSQLFADAINANFSGLAGHLPMHPGLLRDWFEEDIYLEDGIALLLQGSRPVGTVCVMRDSEDHSAGDISALSVGREYRGRGLGRLLLRHAVCFAAWQGLQPIYLSLNAENDTALQLYLSEGFVVTDKMVCYSMDCTAQSTAVR